MIRRATSISTLGLVSAKSSKRRQRDAATGLAKEQAKLVKAERKQLERRP